LHLSLTLRTQMHLRAFAGYNVFQDLGRGGP